MVLALFNKHFVAEEDEKLELICKWTSLNSKASKEEVENLCGKIQFGKLHNKRKVRDLLMSSECTTTVRALQSMLETHQCEVSERTIGLRKLKF